MKTLVDYLEKQLQRQYIISNPTFFEEPFEIVDDDTIPDPLTGVTYQQIKEGEIPF